MGYLSFTHERTQFRHARNVKLKFVKSEISICLGLYHTVRLFLFSTYPLKPFSVGVNMKLKPEICRLAHI